jgi:hypothetical protein
VRRLLVISLTAGAISSAIALLSFIAEFTIVRNAESYLAGWYLFWGSLAACTLSALVSAFAGWRVLAGKNSN